MLTRDGLIVPSLPDRQKDQDKNRSYEEIRIATTLLVQ